jgi:Cof subfamily protein (haloacid dehalogenase superfamily)
MIVGESEDDKMIDKITAMVADIDGTLLPKGGKMGPRTLAAIQRFHKEGVLFGIASGRPLDKRITARAKEWGLGFEFDMQIGMNGGDMWDKYHDVVNHYHLLQPDTMKSIMSWMKDFDINAISYINGYEDIWCLRMDRVMEESVKRNHSHIELVSVDKLCTVATGKIEVHYDPDDPELEKRINEAIRVHQEPSWAAVKTFFGTVEFMDPAVNKGLALKNFSKDNNIPLNEIIAFGDMDNDLGLLKDAGWGVCLQNGCDACKKEADAVTEFTVDDDGVGRYLEDHWLNCHK